MSSSVLYDRLSELRDAGLVANRDRNGPSDHFRSRIIGSAVIGMVDSITRQWILSPPHVTFVELYEQGFTLLAPLLDDRQ